MFDNKILFSKEQLERIVRDNLPSQPTHSKMIAGIVDDEGAKFVASLKFNEGWTIIAGFEHEWTGDDKAGIEVFYEWD